MKIQASTNFSNLHKMSPEELGRFIEIFGENVTQVFNGNVELQDNVKCSLVSVTFSAANTDTSVTHTLKRAPAGYIVTSLSAPMTIFTGAVAADKNTYTLQSTAAGTAGLMIF